MKRNALIATIVCLSVVVTLSFQNCNNKQFNTEVSNGISGSLDNMDNDGTIDGDVDFIPCQSGIEECPTSVVIKFFAVENGQENYIGQALGQSNPSVPGSYSFSFTVPSEHKCKPIVAYAVSPQTGALVKLPNEATFYLWGNDPSCGGSTNGGSNGGSNNGGNNGGTNNTANATPSVNITGVKQDGRLVEIRGSCTASAATVDFSGDVLDIIADKNADCSSGSFKHCDLLKKHYMTNFVTGKQTLNSQTAQDTHEIENNSVPVIPFTFETFAKSGDKGLAVTGRCYPGALITLNIYQADIADGKNIPCSSNGTYSYSGSPLVNASDRTLVAFHRTAFSGQHTIKFNVDGENTTPSCSISSTTARAEFCTQQAGTVKGTCLKNMPVHISVNGKEQNIVICSEGGTFEVNNILLDSVGVNNVLKISQKTPYNKSCSATKNMMNF